MKILLKLVKNFRKTEIKLSPQCTISHENQTQSKKCCECLQLKKRLVPAPTDLSKLNDVVKVEVVKRAVYDKLVEKANVISSSGSVKKQIMMTR